MDGLKLYNEVRELGLKTLLTGRSDGHEAVTVENLKKQGFHDWDKLILRSTQKGCRSSLVKMPFPRLMESQIRKEEGNGITRVATRFQAGTVDFVCRPLVLRHSDKRRDAADLNTFSILALEKEKMEKAIETVQSNFNIVRI